MTEVEQWVIYDHPADHPAWMVVRRWTIFDGRICPDAEAFLCLDLEEARKVVADNYPSAYRLDRQPNDDPTIIEVWI